MWASNVTTNEDTPSFVDRERPRRLSTSPATVAHMQSMTRAESDSCLFMNPVDAATTNSPTPAPSMTPMGASGSAEDILAPLETRKGLSSLLWRIFSSFRLF